MMHPLLLPLVHKMAGHAAVLFAGIGGLVAVDFRDQITTGSIIVSVVIIVVAGLVTWRSKVATIWREEAEGQRAAKERVQADLAAALLERADFAREQQDLRHNLKDTIAAQTMQIRALEAKTDLTAALASIREMNEGTVAAVSSAVSAAITEGIRASGSEARDVRTHELLEEIRDRMAPPTTEGTDSP